MTLIAAATLDGSPGWLASALAVALALAGVALLRRVRGTTLTAPTLWWIAAALALAAVEAAVATGRLAPASLGGSLWRYAAAVGSFCPLIAVLGAKRPQDRGWQWVVVALWLVLLAPAGQALAAPTGHRLELFGAWRLLLWGLAAMGLLNYLPTRFALSAFLVAAGQIVLFSQTTNQFQQLDAATSVAIALALFHAAWLAGEIARRPRCSAPHEAQAARWLAFRDHWGSFWALRVMQRINQTAELAAWPIRLQWGGFVDASDGSPVWELPPDLASALDQSLDNVLRRFERLPK
ncbi:hypothetical protein [Lacipirellula parvula]|uniref:Uncharacterized protein n=1 Tax=Lacipirellula parvula TaxID=2650471 RepID=A0A5K7XI77_9BACT|nr:hypothetical protein [Lacipirellula parvula]BBO33996.1 hypothetical protein PLANPX_3608 [Lacipirellula parvula]